MMGWVRIFSQCVYYQKLCTAYISYLFGGNGLHVGDVNHVGYPVTKYFHFAMVYAQRSNGYVVHKKRFVRFYNVHIQMRKPFYVG